MNDSATIKWILAGALGIAAMGLSSAFAQSTLGGPKTPQNKIGGVAKPAPVIGGATIHTPTPLTAPKPGPLAGLAKPNSSTGTPTPGPTSGAAKPNPPYTPPNKGGTAVTASQNLKCGSGACTSKGPKP
jgi:hypothetical protein